MNEITLESFITYCDDMMIAEEGLGGRILLKRDPYAKIDYATNSVLLYHGSGEKLDQISPNAVSMGNRLEPRKTKSSFWTPSYDRAVCYAMYWVLRNFDGLNGFRAVQLKSSETFKDPSNYPDYLYGIPDLDIVKKGRKPVYIVDFIVDWYKKSKKKVYVYKANIPIQYVYGGHTTDEYTVRDIIIPKESHEVTPDEIRDHLIGVTEECDDLFDRDDHRRPNGLLEHFIYKKNALQNRLKKWDYLDAKLTQSTNVIQSL